LKDSDLESLGKKAGALKISEDSLGNSSEEERKTPPNSAQILKESETNGLKNQSSNVLDSSESFSLNVLEDTPRAVRAGGESNSPANSSSNGPERTSNPISPVSSDGEKVEDF
jgi:hypothetical protein